MPRDILTKRLADGWASECGRVRAVRDRSGHELRDAVRRGDAVVSSNVSFRLYWTVELLSPDGSEVWDDDSVDTLDEAEDQAGWFMVRIDEGRDHPDYDPDAE